MPRRLKPQGFGDNATRKTELAEIRLKKAKTFVETQIAHYDSARKNNKADGDNKAAAICAGVMMMLEQLLEKL